MADVAGWPGWLRGKLRVDDNKPGLCLGARIATVNMMRIDDDEKHFQAVVT